MLKLSTYLTFSLVFLSLISTAQQIDPSFGDGGLLSFDNHIWVHKADNQLLLSVHEHYLDKYQENSISELSIHKYNTSGKRLMNFGLHGELREKKQYEARSRLELEIENSQLVMSSGQDNDWGIKFYDLAGQATFTLESIPDIVDDINYILPINENDVILGSGSKLIKVNKEGTLDLSFGDAGIVDLEQKLLDENSRVLWPSSALIDDNLTLVVSNMNDGVRSYELAKLNLDGVHLGNTILHQFENADPAQYHCHFQRKDGGYLLRYGSTENAYYKFHSDSGNKSENWTVSIPTSDRWTSYREVNRIRDNCFILLERSLLDKTVVDSKDFQNHQDNYRFNLVAIDRSGNLIETFGNQGRFALPVEYDVYRVNLDSEKNLWLDCKVKDLIHSKVFKVNLNDFLLGKA